MTNARSTSPTSSDDDRSWITWENDRATWTLDRPNNLQCSTNTLTIKLFRSASSLLLNVRHTLLSKVSDQAFPAAAATTWHVRTLSVFRGRLKAFVFQCSLPWLLPQYVQCHLNRSFLARDSIYAIARYMPSPVRLSVRHMGGSVKDGWS